MLPQNVNELSSLQKKIPSQLRCSHRSNLKQLTQEWGHKLVWNIQKSFFVNSTCDVKNNTERSRCDTKIHWLKKYPYWNIFGAPKVIWNESVMRWVGESYGSIFPFFLILENSWDYWKNFHFRFASKKSSQKKCK